MNRKKHLLPFLTILLLLFASACSGNGDAKLEGSVSDLYQNISQTVELPAMSNLDQETIYNLYGIAPEEYTAYLFYTSDAPEKGDQILFFEAVDEETAEKIAQVMKNDLEQQRNAANNYYPEKYALLEGVEPTVDGVYVYTVASAERENIIQLIQQALH